MSEQILSVVVSCFNVEKYIDKCLISILNQTYKNLDIICVDNNSTDKTLQKLKVFADRDSRVRVVHLEKNRGPSASRNEGIRQAKGGLITFVDGDDELALNAYQIALKKWRSDIDVVWFGIRVIYEAHTEYKKSDKNYYTLRRSGEGTIKPNELLDFDCSVCNKIFRKELLTQDFQFKEDYFYEDALFFMKFFAIERKILFVKQNLYNYYRHPISIMASTFSKKEGMSLYHIYILDDLFKFWKERGILDKERISFQRIAITYFWLAYNHALKYERAHVVYEMTKRLRHWNIGSEANPILSYIQDGTYEINFGEFRVNGPKLKPELKGFKKLVSLQNENGHRVLRIFTKRIASKKVR